MIVTPDEKTRDEIAMALATAKARLESLQYANVPNKTEDRAKLEALLMDAMRDLAAAERRRDAWLKAQS